jgi:hypothetical protein
VRWEQQDQAARHGTPPPRGLRGPSSVPTSRPRSTTRSEWREETRSQEKHAQQQRQRDRAAAIQETLLTTQPTRGGCHRRRGLQRRATRSGGAAPRGAALRMRDRHAPRGRPVHQGRRCMVPPSAEVVLSRLLPPGGEVLQLQLCGLLRARRPGPQPAARQPGRGGGAQPGRGGGRSSRRPSTGAVARKRRRRGGQPRLRPPSGAPNARRSGSTRSRQGPRQPHGAQPAARGRRRKARGRGLHPAAAA